MTWLKLAHFCVCLNLDTGNCLEISQTLIKSIRDYRVCARADLQEPSGVVQAIPLDAIFGIYDLLSGSYIALIVQSTPAIKYKKIEYRKATKMVVISLFKHGKVLSEEKQRDEEKYLELLHTGFTSHQFYFSYEFDVTHSFQRIAKMTNVQLGQPVWSRADARFFWNRDVVVDLIACNADEWITPVMSAYVELRPDCVIDNEKFSLLFISRRSMYRQGARFTKRGIDEDGHVANFVETEQAVIWEDGTLKAYVQVRGSIPVFWASPVHMKYAPKVYVETDPVGHVQACDKHVEDLLTNYSDPHGEASVLFINLIDKKKEQHTLGTVFSMVINEVVKRTPKTLKYVWFDFHHECRKMKWGNLAKLVHQVDEDFQKQGFFHKNAEGRPLQWQKGVIRTNCMDNLDRTNVVQSLFARRSLLIAFGKQEALSGNVLDTPYKAFEKIYKDVWGNNADAISMLYAGTGALKTDFTRTGKRTKKGLLLDGYNSCLRYYLNNFVDGERQDAIDLMIGRYKVVPTAPSPFVPRPSQETLSGFLTKMFVLLVAIFAVCVLFTPANTPGAFTRSLRLAAALTICCMAFIAYRAIKKGSKLGEQLVVLPSLILEPLPQGRKR